MKLYMAGGINGNLKPMYNYACEQMDAGKPFEQAIKTAYAAYLGVGGRMKIYLADSGTLREAYCEEPTIKYRPYILESFYYADKNTERLLPYFGDFLLDSGAFTFMENAGKTVVDWDDYIERYAAFITRNNIDKFFELDIDSIVGYPKVIEMRHRLEDLVGKPCIPVWHQVRGKDDFLKCCEEYNYVALGGIVGKEWKVWAEKYMPWFIREAHRRGTKIHGLGYTKLDKLRQYHFDSVDSTAWTAGNRFGFIYQFKNGRMIKYPVPKGKRIGSARQAAVINFTEWIKFQKWAEVNL